MTSYFDPHDVSPSNNSYPSNKLEYISITGEEAINHYIKESHNIPQTNTICPILALPGPNIVQDFLLEKFFCIGC